MSADLAFARLVAYSRPLRGWAAVRRERPGYNRAYLRRLVEHSGVADVAVSLDEVDDGPCASYHRAWVQRVRDWYRLPAEPGALGSLCYLFFHDVAEHDDGPQVVYEPGPYLEKDALFLNIHQVGEGLLTVAGKSFRIRPGDAYLLNPSARHGWKSDDKSLNKAVSLAVPTVLVPQLLQSSSSEQSIHR